MIAADFAGANAFLAPNLEHQPLVFLLLPLKLPRAIAIYAHAPRDGFDN